MKHKIYILSIIIAAFLTGCDDRLKETVNFDMSILPSPLSGIQVG